MQPNKGIFWLASYPKSGNTWFRIVLANVLNQSSSPVPLNQINTGVTASSRGLINTALGFDSSLLSHDELDALRPSIYRWYSEQPRGVHYFKTHDAYGYVGKNSPLIPNQGTLGALYFLRNPLDVTISFAHHFNCSIDQIIEIMGNKTFALYDSTERANSQLRQYFLSWSQHVQSWLSATEIDVLLLRYEDMKFAPLATFKKAINFLKLDVPEAHILNALDNTHIEKLQHQEQQFGFEEKSYVQQSQFFRKGIVGDWENTLNDAQVERIISDHGTMMRAYGYLDKHNQPVRYHSKDVVE
jgi:hypothetical protein